MNAHSARPFQSPGAGFRGGAGGQNIVEQQEAFSRYPGRIGNPESALHIAPARLGRSHRTLAGR